MTRRENWRRAVRRFGVERLVFPDETAVTTKLLRTHGRSPRGERVVDAIPGSWRKVSVVSALRRGQAFATQALCGSFDNLAFFTWAKCFLAPRLKPGDVVVLDNLKPHRQSSVRKAIRQVGADVRFLPPDSPDLNPIEELWSKVKCVIRAKRPRTVDEIRQACQEAFSHITHQDIDGWIHHAYPSLIL